MDDMGWIGMDWDGLGWIGMGFQFFSSVHLVLGKLWRTAPVIS